MQIKLEGTHRAIQTSAMEYVLVAVLNWYTILKSGSSLKSSAFRERTIFIPVESECVVIRDRSTKVRGQRTLNSSQFTVLSYICQLYECSLMTTSVNSTPVTQF